LSHAKCRKTDNKNDDDAAADDLLLSEPTDSNIIYKLMFMKDFVAQKFE